MDTGDGFSIDTDLMSVLNSQEITSTAGLQEALTQIEGRYRTQLDTQVVDTIKQAYASHRRIAGLWLHFKDWTEGLDKSTRVAADKIRLAFADIPDTVTAISHQNNYPSMESNIPASNSNLVASPVASIGGTMGQFLSGFTQSLQQIPQMATQIPQTLQGLGQPLQQAFQPMQELIQEITQAIGNEQKSGNLDTASESDTHYVESDNDFRPDHRHYFSHKHESPQLETDLTDQEKEFWKLHPEIDHSHIVHAKVIDANSSGAVSDPASSSASESQTHHPSSVETEPAVDQTIEDTFKDDPVIGDNITIN